MWVYAHRTTKPKTRCSILGKVCELCTFEEYNCRCLLKFFHYDAFHSNSSTYVCRIFTFNSSVFSFHRSSVVHQVLGSTYELYESSAVHNSNERNKEAQSSDGGCHANGLLPMHHNNQPTLVALRQSSKGLEEKLPGI